jgi:predicted  nucleic acid-binding Zn-ribbon protein
MQQLQHALDSKQSQLHELSTLLDEANQQLLTTQQELNSSQQEVTQLKQQLETGQAAGDFLSSAGTSARAPALGGEELLEQMGQLRRQLEAERSGMEAVQAELEAERAIWEAKEAELNDVIGELEDSCLEKEQQVWA